MNRYSSLAVRIALTTLFAFLLSFAASPLPAARPTAARLLPEKTSLMVSVPNVQELAQKFMNTNLGQMMQDPQMQPFIETLYGSLGELVESAKDKIGLSLKEIVALPQGEITFAMVNASDSGPGVVFIFEAGGQIDNARKLLKNALRDLKVNREETIGEVKCTIYQTPGDNLIIFEKDAAIAICNKIEIAKEVLDLWNEKKDARSLAENANYGVIANRCRGSKDEEPQLIWYYDPIGLMKNMAETNTGMQLAVAMLPALGLDGLGGLGGSILFDTEQYDTMLHLHILLTSPRTGVFKVIAFEPGVTKPERWVPGDIASYLAFHWNFPTSLKAIETIFDSFRGEDGAFAETLQNFGGRIDVDLQKQIIPALDGRVTFLRWIEKPAVSMQSAHSLVAFKLKDKEKDGESIQKVLDGIAKKFADTVSSKSSAGKSYYAVTFPVFDPSNGRQPPQVPQPCFGIVDDYLMISDHPGIYERVLATAADGSKSLGGELDFKIISSKLQRIVGDTKPAMLSFDRPEEGMRFIYDLVTSDRAKERLQRRAEHEAFFKSINSSMEKQPLPPFSVLQKYLAPGGAIVIDDDTGIHFMNFTLKRKAE